MVEGAPPNADPRGVGGFVDRERCSPFVSDAGLWLSKSKRRIGKSPGTSATSALVRAAAPSS